MPSKIQMFEDLKFQTYKDSKDVDSKPKIQRVLISNRKYVNQLSEVADIEKIPEVIHAISDDIGVNLEQQPTQFRNFKYNIIDKNAFTKEYYAYWS